MKYKNKFNYLNTFLNITLVVLILPVISILYLPFIEDLSINTFTQAFIKLILVIGYIIIILTLKKILKSIRNRDPFNTNNVTYFKKIGYYVLVTGIIYGIMSYPLTNNSGLYIMKTSYGSLKPTFFLHLILSLLSFVISDTFKMAMEIKNENDLTV